jgi:hypothetical protein
MYYENLFTTILAITGFCGIIYWGVSFIVNKFKGENQNEKRRKN